MSPNAHRGKAVLADRLNLITSGPALFCTDNVIPLESRVNGGLRKPLKRLIPSNYKSVSDSKELIAFPTHVLTRTVLEKISENHPISVRATELEYNFCFFVLTLKCLLQDPRQGSVPITASQRGRESSQEF